MVARPTRFTTLVVAAATLVLAGCSGGSGNTSGAGATHGSNAGTVNLTFWNGLTGPDRPAVEKLVSDFNASQTAVKVTMDIQPWDVLYQKLLPAFQAGTGPDLVGMDSNQIPVYASKNVLQPIDSFFTSGGIERSQLVAPAVAAGTFQGKVYGVPIENTPVLLYYNKKEFQAAGLDPAKPPTTWDEWAADAKKLTQGSGPDGKPTQYGLAFGVHDTIELMPILMWQAGGGIASEDGATVLLNSEASKQAVSYWANLVAKDHISPVGLSGADADKLISAGTAAMEVNGPWATTGYKQAGIDYGLAMVPTGPNGKQITLGNTTSLVVSAKADAAKVAAAATFYTYWMQSDQQVAFAAATGFPPFTTNVPDSALSSNPDVVAFATYAQYARSLAPGQPNFASIQSEIFDPTIEKIFNDPSSVNSALDGAASQLSSQLVKSGS